MLVTECAALARSRWAHWFKRRWPCSGDKMTALGHKWLFRHGARKQSVSTAKASRCVDGETPLLLGSHDRKASIVIPTSCVWRTSGGGV